MDDHVRRNMQKLIYFLTKNAARYSYIDFLSDECGITEEEYQAIKEEWKLQGIEPYV
jgi:hypothetical protein